MWREEQLSESTGNLSGGLAVLARQILPRLPLQVCFQLVASCRWEPREGTKHSEKTNKKTFNLLFPPAPPGWQQWCYENLCVYSLRTQPVCSREGWKEEMFSCFCTYMFLKAQDQQIISAFLDVCLLSPCHLLLWYAERKLNCMSGRWMGWTCSRSLTNIKF